LFIVLFESSVSFLTFSLVVLLLFESGGAEIWGIHKYAQINTLLNKQRSKKIKKEIRK